MYKFGPVQQKTLLLLLGGITLGSQRSSARYYRLLRELRKEWKQVDRRSMTRSLRRLSEQKLVEEKTLSDGSIRLVLTKEGKRQARFLDLYGQSIRLKRPRKWDGKWRVIIFDIPEDSRTFRNILRQHLREMEFHQLQKSVFVSPHPYEKPLLELVNLYGAAPFVHIMTVTWIDNGEKLKRHFFDK
jgi:DNA-binding transcriptional regulator PaaX